jgi:hypothetical protein
MEMSASRRSPQRHRGHRGTQRSTLFPSFPSFSLFLFISVSSVPLWLSGAGRVEAQAEPTAHGQAWEVHVDSGRVTVGDTVGLTFRVRLDERDLLFDTIPRPVDSALDGVRIVSVEKLHRLPNRDFVGRAVLAFYRTGPQPVPVFALPFMRAVKGITSGAIRSDTLSVDVKPVLAAGNPTLRDIRELQPSAVPEVLIGMVTALVLVLILLVARRRRRPATAAPELVVIPQTASSPPPPDPYDIAVARLDEIERQAWSDRGDVARHYEAVVDTLRDYLEAAEDVPARERTTTEVLWSLPPHLVEGALRQRYTIVFDEADLVKFARHLPDSAAATRYLSNAHGLLDRWHASRKAVEVADAVR